jgi:hypothetical protein
VIGDLKSHPVKIRLGREMVGKKLQHRNDDIIEDSVGSLVLGQQMSVEGCVVIGGNLQHHAALEIDELDPALVGLGLPLRVKARIAAKDDRKWEPGARNGVVQFDELLKILLLGAFEVGFGDFGGTDLAVCRACPQQERG